MVVGDFCLPLIFCWSLNFLEFPQEGEQLSQGIALPDEMGVGSWEFAHLLTCDVHPAVRVSPVIYFVLQFRGIHSHCKKLFSSVSLKYHRNYPPLNGLLKLPCNEKLSFLQLLLQCCCLLPLLRTVLFRRALHSLHQGYFSVGILKCQFCLLDFILFSHFLFDFGFGSYPHSSIKCSQNIRCNSFHITPCESNWLAGKILHLTIICNCLVYATQISINNFHKPKVWMFATFSVELCTVQT